MNPYLRTECVVYKSSDIEEASDYERLGVEIKPSPVFLPTQLDVREVTRIIGSTIEKDEIEYDSCILILEDGSRCEVLEDFEKVAELQQKVRQ